MGQTCIQRRFLAEIPAEADQLDTGIQCTLLRHAHRCLIGAAIINENDFACSARSFETGKQAVEKGTDIPRFIIGWHDDRE